MVCWTRAVWLVVVVVVVSLFLAFLHSIAWHGRAYAGSDMLGGIINSTCCCTRLGWAFDHPSIIRR